MSAEIQLLKEQQRSKELYEMCENLWQTLNAVKINYEKHISEHNYLLIQGVLNANNPSKLKSDD